MLTLLKIKNLALVDHLEWDLGGGLVGVTGETGAGKSVIVGALKLILGERADKGMIRTGESQCSVEAIFQLQDVSLVNQVLEDAGLDPCEDNELIIRRVIGSQSNRQFVNNGASTLGVLKRIGCFLVDLHGPHEHQSLLSPERQLSLLDAYSDLGQDLARYRKVWEFWVRARDEYELARSEREISNQERELLRFQVDEIDAAELQPGEEEILEERYLRTRNAHRLAELAGKAVGVLSDGISPHLEELQRLLSELRRIDPMLADTVDEVESSSIQIQELERNLTRYLDELDTDPVEINEVEERYNQLTDLKRKYGPCIEDVMEHANDSRRRLENSENREQFLTDLKSKADEFFVDLRRLGRKLSGEREKNAPLLASDIRKHLIDLGFKQAEFEVGVVARDTPGGNGFDTVEYLFGPNPGEPLKPLRQIASSGEISRVMLAVKNALANQDSTPLMVFDEIDANVGGEIARVVGEKMASLGTRHQVVAITHFPQVAAVAHQHFLVEKTVEGGRSLSKITEVTGEQRIDELVRMLGGGEGLEAREMAKSLLK
jgi:DNA repair protein RecN (Recombination protein N)